MKKVLFALCLFSVLVVGANARPVQDESECRRVSDDYFSRQESGQDVESLFCYSRDAVKNFNVKSHNITSVTCNDFGCTARVYVQQTNAGGREIGVTWLVEVRTRPEGSCIHKITKTD
ncbi:MAG: hypothetical protein K1Y36_06820 [Blastocatellia bacterium]|nr:hypothetical protein [Blastocatellia bacterium]